MTPSAPTPEQLRDDIDRGRTGDKAPGLDPAAAPLGADEEAGGAGPTPAETAAARRAERRPASTTRPNAVDPGLPPNGQRSRSPASPGHWVLVAVIGLGLAVTTFFAINYALGLFGAL